MCADIVDQAWDKLEKLDYSALKQKWYCCRATIAKLLRVVVQGQNGSHFLFLLIYIIIFSVGCQNQIFYFPFKN